MMHKIIIFLVVVLHVINAHAEGNLAITKTAQINVPAPAVWKVIGDFNTFNKWHPAVVSDEIVAGENNTAGAVRLLTLGDGGTIREKLLSHDDSGMSLSYSILEGVLPVRDYVSILKVERLTDNSCKVTWSGSFSAAPGTDNKQASDTISRIYEEGLDQLLQMMSVP